MKGDVGGETPQRPPVRDSLSKGAGGMDNGGGLHVCMERVSEDEPTARKAGAIE